MAKKTAGKKATLKPAAKKPVKKPVKKVEKKATPVKAQKKASKGVAVTKAKPEPKKAAASKSTGKIEMPIAPQNVSPVEKLAADEAEFSMPAIKPPKIKKKSKRQLAAEEELDQMGKKWAALLKKTEKLDIKPSPYNMRKSYDARTPIEHKILGWGYILANKNDRLEVLFKDGIKFLISNYKG